MSLSSLCWLQFIRVRLALLEFATLDNSAHTLTLRKFHENLCNCIVHNNSMRFLLVLWNRCLKGQLLSVLKLFLLIKARWLIHLNYVLCKSLDHSCSCLWNIVVEPCVRYLLFFPELQVSEVLYLLFGLRLVRFCVILMCVWFSTIYVVFLNLDACFEILLRTY